MNETFYGKIISRVDGLHVGSDEVVITFTDGSALHMWHEQDCCESVSICDIDTSADLVGAAFYDLDVSSKEGETDYGDEEWTFYTIQTDRGYTWIRWYGESNGYYSTSVSYKFCEAGEARSCW